MTKIRTLLTLSVLSVTSAAWGGTFLQVFETNSQVLEFNLTNTGGTGNSFTVTNGAVNFQFSVPNALGTGIRPGLLNISATSTAASAPDGSGNQVEGGFSGTASIFDSVTGTTAISWTFGPTGTLSVALGTPGTPGTGGTFSDSRPPATEVNFLSPYLSFASSTSESFSFGLSGGTPGGAVGAGGHLADEAFSGVGTFDAIPLPVGTPEPATMAMLGGALVGLGLVGRKRFAR
jgi:hypothetical protein